MKLRTLIAALSCLCVPALAVADLEPWQDYEVSDAVWSITTVKVHSNMSDAYLEGLRETWIPGNEISKELGQIEDYWIYRSDTEDSGDFNLLLVVKFADTEALAPNKENYEKFMAKYTKAQSDKSTAYAQKNYPAMRDITGEYRMRRIIVK